MPDKTEKEKPKKNPNKRKGQTQEAEETKPKKPKNKAKNKEEQDGNLDEPKDRNEPSNDEDKEEKIGRTNKQKNNKEAMWLYAELFLGIWNVQKCQNVQILKLLGVLCRNK